MRRLGPTLCLLLAVGAVPAVLPDVAGAATTTCRGQDATLTGTPGKPLTGTDGADVIVSNGATQIDPGAGDDVVCLTGTVGSTVVKVLDAAGDGSDTVEDDMTYTGPAVDSNYHVQVFLADGENTFVGGPAPELVAATGGGVDHIATGAASDSVVLGGGADTTDSLTPDVDLGADGGSVVVNEQVAAGSTLDGGSGPASITFADGAFAGSGAWSIDAGTGTMTVDGAVRLRTPGITGYVLGQHDVASFTGTEGADQLVARDVTSATMLGGSDGLQARSITAADLGAGDDAVTVGSSTTDPGGTIDAGTGADDAVTVVGRNLLKLDVTKGTIGSGGSRAPLRLTGFDRFGAYAFQVLVQGSTGPDRLAAGGCRLSVHGNDGDDLIVFSSRDPYSETAKPCSTDQGEVVGGGGDDTIVAVGRTAVVHGSAGDDTIRSGGRVYGDPGDDTITGGAGPDLIIGGDGDDVLRGGAGNDELRGGPGTDVGDGQAGRDTCVGIEKQVSCR